MFALFPLVDTDSFGLIVLAASVGQVAVGAMFGPGTAIWAAMFPPVRRYAGVSFGTQISNSFGGGLAPFTMVAPFAATGTSVSASVWVALSAAPGVIAIALIRLPAARWERHVAGRARRNVPTGCGSTLGDPGPTAHRR